MTASQSLVLTASATLLQALLPFVEMVDHGLVSASSLARNSLSKSAGSIFRFLRTTVAVSWFLREVVEHGEQRVPAPLVVDVIADLAGLEVADGDLRGRRGVDEAAVELGDGQKLFLFDGGDLVGAEAVAPFGRDGGLFVDGEAFGKPAGHAVCVSVRVKTWLISCHKVDAQ